MSGLRFAAVRCLPYNLPLTRPQVLLITRLPNTSCSIGVLPLLLAPTVPITPIHPGGCLSSSFLILPLLFLARHGVFSPCGLYNLPRPPYLPRFFPLQPLFTLCYLLRIPPSIPHPPPSAPAPKEQGNPPPSSPSWSQSQSWKSYRHPHREERSPRPSALIVDDANFSPPTPTKEDGMWDVGCTMVANGMRWKGRRLMGRRVIKSNKAEA